MTQHLPTGYVFDPEDPRAPTHEQWTAMSPPERARVVAMLPARVPLDLLPPEGDQHRKAKESTLRTLDDFFRRAGRRIYLSSELAVFYPGEPRFAPDLLAVRDVDPHERTKWAVDDEGRGLDLVLDIHVAERAPTERAINLDLDRYARLGIQEYFLFNRRTLSLRGYRLSTANDSRAGHHEALKWRAGGLTSEVLGLELRVEGTRLRFLRGYALLEDADESLGRLGKVVDELIARNGAANDEVDRITAQLAESERRLSDALAEIARLRKPPG